MAASNRTLAIVTPWFSSEEIGGAQMLAWQLAHALAAESPVDVLTTCARSFNSDWSRNHYREGAAVAGKITVRRFAVRSRDAARFAVANSFLLSRPLPWFAEHRSRIPSEVASGFCDENIHAPDLLRFLSDWGRQYRAVIFTPYLYGPALSGVKLVADRAYVQPCLHDEGYAYLPQVEQIFKDARGLLFNSRAEFELARRLYGDRIVAKSKIVGHWVEPPLPNVKPRRGRYLLYLGRSDSRKNLELLIGAFLDHKRRFDDSSLRLTLAGTAEIEMRKGCGIEILGPVSSNEKHRLLQSCIALMQPSLSESYSRTVMEAWSYTKPVAAHASCTATASAIEESGGGWTASSFSDWSQLISQIDSADAVALRNIGACGYRYYLAHGTPARTLERYRDALRLERVREAFGAAQ